MKCVQTAIAENQDWRLALENYLLCYRSTPHATTGLTPAEMMFGHPIKDKLPLPQPQQVSNRSDVLFRDAYNKKKIKTYADKARHATQNVLKAGDDVLIKNQNKHRNKFTSRWSHQPGTVKEVKGNSVIVQHNDKEIMRTSSHVKPYKLSIGGQLSSFNGNYSESDSDTSHCVDDVNNDSDTTIDTIAYENDIDDAIEEDLGIPVGGDDNNDAEADIDDREIDHNDSDIDDNNDADIDTDSEDNREIRPAVKRQVKVPKHFDDYVLE